MCWWVGELLFYFYFYSFFILFSWCQSQRGHICIFLCVFSWLGESAFLTLQDDDDGGGGYHVVVVVAVIITVVL